MVPVFDDETEFRAYSAGGSVDVWTHGPAGLRVFTVDARGGVRLAEAGTVGLRGRVDPLLAAMLIAANHDWFVRVRRHLVRAGRDLPEATCLAELDRL